MTTLACGGAAQEGEASATSTTVKKLPRANRVAPKHDEEDNDDPSITSSEDTELDETGKPVRKKPQPTTVATAKSKTPSAGRPPTPPPGTPRPPPNRDQR